MRTRLRKHTHTLCKLGNSKHRTCFARDVSTYYVASSPRAARELAFAGCYDVRALRASSVHKVYLDRMKVKRRCMIIDCECNVTMLRALW